MSDGSAIEWLARPGTKPASWNAVRGCTRASEGCRHCYAETMAARFSEPGMWGHGFAEMTSKGPRWTGKVELIESQLSLPLHWRGPRTIFVNSTSDLFHERLPDEAIDRAFAVMALCRWHTFIILSKRAERMRDYAVHWMERLASSTAEIDHPAGRTAIHRLFDWSVMPDVLPNIWWGTSIEDRQTGVERAYHLANTPARLRFWSVEPLLADLGDLTSLCFHDTAPDGKRCVDWVIVGSESGHGARPCDLAWVRSIRDQCVSANVPFFWKQHAVSGRKIHTPELDGQRWTQWPEVAS